MPAHTTSPDVGPATQVTVSGAGDIVIGKPFFVTVQYKDAAGNLVDDSNIIASVSLAANANLTGVLSQHLAGGQALFTSLAIDTPGTYTLHVTAGQCTADLPAFSAKGPTWALDTRNIDRQITDQGADGNTVLAIDSKASSYVSHDRGQTWQALSAGQGYCNSYGCADPRGHLDVIDSNIIYFPNSVSRDGGNTFAAISYARLAQDASGTLYGTPTGTGHSLTRSSDHGLTWTTVEDFQNRSLMSVVVDPNGAIVTCFNETATCASSRDGGMTWNEGSTTGAYNPIMALYADPAQAGVIYGKIENPAGILRSTDLGGTWAQVPLPWSSPLGDAYSLVISSSPASRLYALDHIADSNDPYNTAAVAVSDDGGQTWKRIGFGVPAGCIDLKADVADPRTLYADCPVDTNGTFKLFVTHTAGQ